MSNKRDKNSFIKSIYVSDLTENDQIVKSNMNYLLKASQDRTIREKLGKDLGISLEDIKNYVALDAKIMPSKELQEKIEEYFDLPRRNLKLTDPDLKNNYRAGSGDYEFTYYCSDLSPNDRKRIKQNIINLINNKAKTKENKAKMKKDLARICGITDNAISNFLNLNNGKVPDRDNLKVIAKYFHTTLDELIYTEIPDEPLRDILINEKETIQKIYENLLPIIEYADHYPEKKKNAKFIEGISIHEKLLDFVFEQSISNHLDEVESLMLLYKEAAKEGAVEALANHLWWLMYFGISVFSVTNRMVDNSNELKKDGVKVSDIFKLDLFETPINNISIADNMEVIQQTFLNDYEEMIIQDIFMLAQSGYCELASFYTAIRYIFGIIRNDLTSELNRTVGYEMLRSLCLMGNTYAIDFYEIFEI